jgi:phosphoglycerate dehydrogenase-like enzyme
MSRLKIAVLDDYQGVALSMADWTAVKEIGDVHVFRDHEADEDRLVERLLPFDVVCVMRERTPLTRSVVERLPRLRMVASTGPANRSIDRGVVEERGIAVLGTGYSSEPAIEMTWALILGSVRHVAADAASVRAGGWQSHLGGDLAGKTLGVVGLGNIGRKVAAIGLAFGMHVIAWSQNLTEQKAAESSVHYASKEELFRTADIVTIHLLLSSRTESLVGEQELSLMKRGARLVNTSRGPIVNESALITALRRGDLAGAALDVYDQEPLPADHPFRSLPNVLATPHVGYVTESLYRTFYEDTVRNVLSWAANSRAD